jgi:uncharacterized membrane protein YcaP (DUF421 family)
MRNSSELAIEKDLDFQYRSWHVQRIGWLVGIDIGLSLLKQRFSTIERYLDGLPLVLVADDSR